MYLNAMGTGSLQAPFAVLLLLSLFSILKGTVQPKGRVLEVVSQIQFLLEQTIGVYGLMPS